MVGFPFAFAYTLPSTSLSGFLFFKKISLYDD